MNLQDLSTVAATPTASLIMNHNKQLNKRNDDALRTRKHTFQPNTFSFNINNDNNASHDNGNGSSLANNNYNNNNFLFPIENTSIHDQDTNANALLANLMLTVQKHNTQTRFNNNYNNNNSNDKQQLATLVKQVEEDKISNEKKQYLQQLNNDSNTIRQTMVSDKLINHDLQSRIVADRHEQQQEQNIPDTFDSLLNKIQDKQANSSSTSRPLLLLPQRVKDKSLKVQQLINNGLILGDNNSISNGKASLKPYSSSLSLKQRLFNASSTNRDNGTTIDYPSAPVKTREELVIEQLNSSYSNGNSTGSNLFRYYDTNLKPELDEVSGQEQNRQKGTRTQGTSESTVDNNSSRINVILPSQRSKRQQLSNRIDDPLIPQSSYQQQPQQQQQLGGMNNIVRNDIESKLGITQKQQQQQKQPRTAATFGNTKPATLQTATTKPKKESIRNRLKRESATQKQSQLLQSIKNFIAQFASGGKFFTVIWNFIKRLIGMNPYVRAQHTSDSHTVYHNHFMAPWQLRANELHQLRSRQQLNASAATSAYNG